MKRWANLLKNYPLKININVFRYIQVQAVRKGKTRSVRHDVLPEHGFLVPQAAFLCMGSLTTYKDVRDLGVPWRLRIPSLGGHGNTLSWSRELPQPMCGLDIGCKVESVGVDFPSSPWTTYKVAISLSVG